MEQNKNRYELILGFVTLILSFSAFKDELKNIVINLGFVIFNLAEFLLYIVYGFGICLYLYIIERIARESKRLNSWKLVSYIERAAFLLFVFIILSPLFLCLAYIVYEIFDNYTKLDEKLKSKITGFIILSVGFIAGVKLNFIIAKYFRSKNKSRQEEIEKEEITDLEKSITLYDKNFYSQAILEAFKVLELHLLRLLVKRQINISKYQFSFNELFKFAIKLELLAEDDIETIKEIRKMRNTVAHLDVKHTQEQALKTIEFIKFLIKKTSDMDNSNDS